MGCRLLDRLFWLMARLVGLHQVIYPCQVKLESGQVFEELMEMFGDGR